LFHIREFASEKKFDEALKFKAETEEKLTTVNHSLKMVPTYTSAERKQLEKDLATLNKRINWQRFSRLDLREMKERAAKKLAKLEAKQAKEDQELFTPTCLRIDYEEEVYEGEAPDLNAAILNALLERRV
jgi:hypothetical protein